MTMRGASSASPADKPTVYRSVAALLGGILAAAFCLYGAVDLLVESGSVDLIGVAVLLLVSALALVFGVYPAAFSDDEGLLVRNPFRTVRLPWDAVTDLSAHLSFVVQTNGARFTVFSIPVSLRERRKAEKTRLREVAQAHRAARRGGTSGGTFGQQSYSQQRYEERIERLAFADQAISEMNVRREAHAARAKVAAGASSAAAGTGGTADGAVAPADAEAGAAAHQPVVRWSWPTLALAGAAAAFLIVAIIVK
jgi:hypothetical protein